MACECGLAHVAPVSPREGATPGAWYAPPHRAGDKWDCILDGDGHIIATVDVDDPPFPREVVMANKALIAAAPDLLAVVKHIPYELRAAGVLSHHWLELAEAAIRKAESTE